MFQFMHGLCFLVSFVFVGINAVVVFRMTSIHEARGVRRHEAKTVHLGHGQEVGDMAVRWAP